MIGANPNYRLHNQSRGAFVTSLVTGKVAANYVPTFPVEKSTAGS